MKYFLNYIKKCQTGTYFFWLSVFLADNDPILLIIVLVNSQDLHDVFLSLLIACHNDITHPSSHYHLF